MPDTIFFCHMSVIYNKTHKSRLKYEVKYDLYEIAQKSKKNLNNLKFRFVEVF